VYAVIWLPRNENSPFLPLQPCFSFNSMSVVATLLRNMKMVLFVKSKFVGKSIGPLAVPQR